MNVITGLAQLSRGGDAAPRGPEGTSASPKAAKPDPGWQTQPEGESHVR